MEYTPAVKKLLDAAGEGWSHTGLVMPCHGFSGENMLPEVPMLKLKHMLGHTEDMKELARLMTTDMAGDINPAISLQEFEDE